jgi:DDE family transposase
VRQQTRPPLAIDALTLVTSLHLLALCRTAVRLTDARHPAALPCPRGGRPRTYAPESLLLIALLRVLWRLSYADMTAWLRAWPALALACGLPQGRDGRPRVPCPATQCLRARQAGAPVYEVVFVAVVREAVMCRIMRLRDLVVDSAPVLAWRRDDPDAAYGHAPAHHTSAFLRGFRVHTALCRGSGLPALFRVAPASAHDAPFAQPLLAAVVALYGRSPRVVRLDAAYWGHHLIGWIHTALGAAAVIPYNPKRTKDRSCLPPTWTRAELAKRGSIERFFGRVFLFFHLQRPPVVGWTAVTQHVALAYTASIIVALAAHRAGRPDLIRSPKRVLAYCWEGLT